MTLKKIIKLPFKTRLKGIEKSSIKSKQLRNLFFYVRDRSKKYFVFLPNKLHIHSLFFAICCEL